MQTTQTQQDPAARKPIVLNQPVTRRTFCEHSPYRTETFDEHGRSVGILQKHSEKTTWFGWTVRYDADGLRWEHHHTNMVFDNFGNLVEVAQ